jgi:hypothetical protein
MRTTDGVTTHSVAVARGGLSLSAILTGVVVAFGAMFLLAALVAGVLTAFGLAEPGAFGGQAVEVGVGAGLVFVLAQFLAYLWGGYTAGRMSRGAGVANGLLVPVAAIALAGLFGGAALLLGETANLNMPFTVTRLPVASDFLIDFGVTIGIGSLIAMLLGGGIGGALGARWHTRLEQAAFERDVYVDEVDLRDSTTPSVPATTTVRRPASGETPISTTTSLGTG